MTILDNNNSETILVLAPTANDGAVTCNVLAGSGLSALPFSNARDLADRLMDPCGAVIIAEEALTDNAAGILHEAIDRQEKWSDIPIILLTGHATVLSNELFSKSGNISLLERPFSRLTLIQAVEVALRSRRRQYQIRDLLAELRKSRDEADRANKAKSQFLANMSHELRTPLNAIVGFSELLDSPTLTQKERCEFTATIRRNSKLLTQLIDDILDLSKVEAGKLKTERTACHLPSLISDVKVTLDQQARDKGIALNFRSEPNVSEFVTTDLMRLKQILLNVIGNAVKFTSKGSVDVVVRESRNSERKTAFLEFVVKDTGLGMTPEQQQNLFSPFSQADASITRKFGGSGLGLALSRRLAEMLGGTIELTSSQIGQGSTFTISIDAGYTNSQNSSKAVGSTNKDTSKDLGTLSLSGMEILVAEDAPDSRFLISRMLKNEGAEVDLATDGIQVVERAQSKDYDVVLMDIQMPNLGGLEATAQLRAKGYRRPIIALTAHAMEEERRKALRAGCNDHMSKPLNFRELVRKLTAYGVSVKNIPRQQHH